MKNWGEKLRRVLTREILRDSAMQAYSDADEKTRQKIMDVAIRAGALAVLNPDKTRQVKEFLTGGGQPSVQNRLEKLKQLHQQGLITGQEYEDKRAEILEEL